MTQVSAGAALIATRDPAEMRAALHEDDRSGLGRHCERLVKHLAEDEYVRAVVACVSGKPCLLAATDRALLFVFKPDGLTPARVVTYSYGDLQAVGVVGEDLLHAYINDKKVGFRAMRPEIAGAMAEMVWASGVSRPAGEVAPEPPSELFPSAAPDVLLETLRLEDRERCSPMVDRICQVLEPNEEVVLLATARSAMPLVVALTTARVLWSASGPSGATVEAVPVRLVLSAVARHGALLVLGVHSTNLPEVAFNEMQPPLAESFVSEIRALGGANEALTARLASTKAPDQKALSALPDKTAKLVRGHIAADETVFLVLVGGFGQALIALADRILIAKAGLMSGNTFGGKVTAFPYREITGVEIHTGWSTGVLVVQTPSFQGTQAGSYWSKGKDQNPAELPNTLPLPNKGLVTAWQPHLQTLRTAISGGGLRRVAPAAPQELGEPILVSQIPPPAPPPPPAESPAPADLASQLNALSQLHSSGVLNDAEFAQAKAKLLA